MESNSSNEKIAIIGAGISGLTLAWNLTRKGKKVIVLDQQQFPGGLATSIEYKENKMDIGPHYVALPKKSDITDELFELVGKENIIELPNNIFEKFYKTNFNGKLYSGYPPLNHIIFNSGIVFFLRSFFEIIISKINSNKEKLDSAEEYLKANYGQFLYKKWFEPYILRRYLDEEPPIDEIKKQFPIPTYSKIFKSIKKKTKNETKGEKIKKEEPSIICYFKEGMGTLIKKLVSEIENGNGELMLGAKVESINHEKVSKKINFQKEGKNESIYVEKIIYSTPLEITRKWFDNIPEEIEKEEPSGIHCILAFLIINKKQIYNSWVVNFYDNNLSFSRIAQQSFLSDTVVSKNNTLLSVEIRTTKSKDLWNLNEDDLIKKIYLDLKKSGILNKEKIIDFKILKLKNLYPKATKKKNKKNKEQLIKFINSFENEYSSHTESDSGILAAGGSGNSSSSKISHGAGVFMAFLKSKKLSEEIVNEL